MKIEPKVNFNLNLEIEQDTIFLSEAEIELDVSCANMSKKEPGRQDTFTVLPELAPQELIALLNLAEFAFEPMRIQQFSIWTITDTPAKDGYVGLRASFSSEGSGPTEQELARIRELFLLTGLDTANYKALQEQWSLLEQTIVRFKDIPLESTPGDKWSCSSSGTWCLVASASKP